jgi:hypothetical protein
MSYGNKNAFVSLIVRRKRSFWELSRLRQKNGRLFRRKASISIIDL